jgi:hypothetical protein
MVTKTTTAMSESLQVLRRSIAFGSSFSHSAVRVTRHLLEARSPTWLIIALIVLDTTSREIIFRTPLYENATLSQPALRLQGAIVGVGIILLAAYAAIRCVRARVRVFPRFVFEWAAASMIALAATGALVGFANRNETVYVLGDTYKLAVVPLTCFATITLVPDLKAALRVITWVVVTGAAGALLLAGQYFESIVKGQSTYGKALPSLFVLIYLLVVLGERRERWQKTLILTTAAGSVLALVFLSLIRTGWIVAAIATGCVTALFPRRLVKILAGLIVAATVFAGLVFVAARPVETKVASSLYAEVAQRVSDLRGLDRTEVAGTVGASSAGERRIEVEDSLADLTAAGPVAFIVGRGNGAEYPTVLPVVDPTTEPEHRHQIHVTWISALYRTGIPGLVILVALVAGAIGTAWRGLKIARGDTRAFRGQAILASWITASAVGLTSVYGLIGEPIWGIALGLLGVMTRSHRHLLDGPDRLASD